MSADETNTTSLTSSQAKGFKAQDYVYGSWVKSDQLRGLPPQTWGLLPHLQLLVLDASLLQTTTDFHERRALLCRTYTEDCVFEDPLACCRGRTATFLYMQLWRLLFPEILIEGQPPKLPSSKAGTTQVCYSSVRKLRLPHVEGGMLGQAMAQLPDSFTFEVVTTLSIDTASAAISHHSENWVGLAGALGLPLPLRGWTAWFSSLSCRAWIIGSGFKHALRMGLWPLQA
eukprot:jgi/Botrbrau1/1489/Bobra.178_3s0044.1